MKKVIYTPTVTAFDENQKIDFEANGRIIEYLISHGIDGLVPMGSTGEFTAFTFKERKEFMEYYAKKVDDRVPIIVGTSSMDFNETLKLTDLSHKLGFKGALVLMPFFYGATQKNIFDFYSTLASKTEANIYIYNYLERTGNDMSADTLLKLLARHENIVGMKDSSKYVGHIQALAKEILKSYKKFELYSGLDDQFNANIMAGGVGCISGLSNIAPDIWVKNVRAANKKDFDGLVKYTRAKNKLMEIYDLDINFSLIFKKLMNLEGLNINEQAIFPFNSMKIGNYEKAVKILREARNLAK